MITRCKGWVVPNHGNEGFRYFLNGHWVTMADASEQEYRLIDRAYETRDFSDGICPECLELMKARMKARRKRRDTP